MKRTYEEHIQRIKQLSLITEDEEKDVNTSDSNSNKEDQVADILDMDVFDKILDKEFEETLNDVTKNINNISNKVGDRDGTLELQGESYKIDEGVGVLAAAVVYSAPKIIEMIGKSVKQLGITANSEVIQKMGQNVYQSGHKLHAKYRNFVLKALQKNGNFRKMDEEKQKKVVELIFLAIAVGIGALSIKGLYHAVESGHNLFAAIKGADVGIISSEIAASFEEIGLNVSTLKILPRILNGLVK